MPLGERIFHYRDLKDQVQSQTHPLVDDPNLGLAHMVHFHQHPGEWHQVYAAVGGNGEACDIDMADNKDGEGTVNKADGRPAAAVAAAAVDMEGTVDEVQEV